MAQILLDRLVFKTFGLTQTALLHMKQGAGDAGSKRYLDMLQTSRCVVHTDGEVSMHYYSSAGRDIAEVQYFQKICGTISDTPCRKS